jgi:hypothetical protein
MITLPEEKRASPDYGGRSVFGIEKASSSPDTPAKALKRL